MERKEYLRKYLILFGLITMQLSVSAQYGTDIYNAYTSGDMNKWEAAVIKMESSRPTSLSKKLELLNYYYGYIGYLIGKEEKSKAKSYIGKGEKLIDALLKEDPDHVEATAYKGSFIAYQMAINRIKTPVLGPKSLRYINTAYKLDPNNLQAIVDKANLLFYAPAVFGGDKNQAIPLYQKAIRKMENENLNHQNWYYLNLLVVLAQHYEKIGEKEKAVHTYQKILKEEPDCEWVKKELYPRVHQR